MEGKWAKATGEKPVKEVNCSLLWEKKVLYQCLGPGNENGEK